MFPDSLLPAPGLADSEPRQLRPALGGPGIESQPPEPSAAEVRAGNGFMVRGVQRVQWV